MTASTGNNVDMCENDVFLATAERKQERMTRYESDILAAILACKSLGTSRARISRRRRKRNKKKNKQTNVCREKQECKK